MGTCEDAEPIPNFSFMPVDNVLVKPIGSDIIATDELMDELTV